MNAQKILATRRKEVRALDLPQIEMRTLRRARRIYGDVFDELRKAKDTARLRKRESNGATPRPCRITLALYDDGLLNAEPTHAGLFSHSSKVSVTRVVGTVTSCHDLALEMLRIIEALLVQQISPEQING